MKPAYENGPITLYHADALDFLAEHSADLVVLDPPLDSKAGWLEGVFDAALASGLKVVVAASAYALVGLRHERLRPHIDEYDHTRGEGFHPDSRPRAWVESLLDAHPATSVLDPFAGSGIVLRVCRDRGIVVCGCERDELYVRNMRELFVEDDARWVKEAVGDLEC